MRSVICLLVLISTTLFCRAQDTTLKVNVVALSDSLFALPAVVFTGIYSTGMPVVEKWNSKKSIEQMGGKVFYDSSCSFYKNYFLDSSGKCYKKGSSLPFTGELKNDALSGTDGNDTILYCYKKGIIVGKKSFFKSGQLAEEWKMYPFNVLELKDFSGENIYVYYEWITCVSLPYKQWYENGQLASIRSENRMQQWYPDGKPASDFMWEEKYTIWRKWNEKGKLVEYRKEPHEKE